MNKKVQPAVVGIFFIGAIVIIVAFVVILGGDYFMKERIPFVMYFDGSINGLHVGAPVVFRGVKVGAVTDIRLEFDQRDMSIRIPVFVEYHPERVTLIGGVSDPKKNIEILVEQGLRGKLEMQSLVTGLLLIAIDFYPDTPATRFGYNNKVPEVPTVPTTFQKLSSTIKDLKLEELALKISRSVAAIDSFLSSPELTESIRSLSSILEDVQHLVRNVDGQVEPLAKDINDVSQATSAVLEKAVSTLSTIDELIAEDGSPRYKLINALEEVSAAARSIKIVADYLERHPEAIVHGKPGTKGKIK